MAAFVAGSQARSLTTSTQTRVAVLPPPPSAGVRTVERLKGEFDENLPTLRLPRIGTRVLLRDLARARQLALAEQAVPSDGVPIAIVPDTTNELSARDLEIEEPEVTIEEIEIDESAQVDTSDLWPIPSGPIVLAPPVVTNDTTPSRIVVLRERTAVYPRVAMPVTSVAISLEPLLQASLGPSYDETAVLELEDEPRSSRAWRGVIIGFAAGVVLAFIVAAMLRPVPQPLALAGALAQLGPEVASVQPRPVHVPPRLVPISPPPPPAVVVPVVPPPSLATPPSPPPTVVVAVAEPRRPARVRSRSRRDSDENDSYEAVAAPPIAAPIPTPVNNGAALLRDAERAFASGRHATALMYADRSRAASNDPRATRIAALAACRLGRVAKAEAAWLALPLGQRTSVKNACRENGVLLGAPKPAATTTPRS